MIWGTLGAARDLSRLREISSVLIRHGLGDLVRRTGLASALERAGQILHWGEAGKSAEIEPQERFRRSLEELGPTFVKLGQILSTRPDSAFAELDRRARASAQRSRTGFLDELLPQVEKALGRSPFDVFADVEREPHAAASIAQVHRAKLPSGAPVVLKIRRPGISAKIAADLRLLDHLANLIEHEMPEARATRQSRSWPNFDVPWSESSTSPSRPAMSIGSRATLRMILRSLYRKCTGILPAAR